MPFYSNKDFIVRYQYIKKLICRINAIHLSHLTCTFYFHTLVYAHSNDKDVHSYINVHTKFFWFCNQFIWDFKISWVVNRITIDGRESNTL